MLSPPSAIQSILSRAGGCPEVLPTGAMVIQGYFLPVTLAMLWISGRHATKFPIPRVFRIAHLPWQACGYCSGSLTPLVRTS